MMVGLTVPDSGHVLLRGEPITNLPMYQRARRGIGYLPQESSVFRRMTVEQNLTAVLELLDVTESERQERMETAMVELGLDHIRTSKAFTLSGGERRRVEIARALVMRPHVLLRAERFAGIDPIALGARQGRPHRLSTRRVRIDATYHSA